MPFGHFFIAYSTDLHASACNENRNNKSQACSVGWHLGPTENVKAVTSLCHLHLSDGFTKPPER
jgi:hypothetical protein